MFRSLFRILTIALIGGVAACSTATASRGVVIPDPIVDAPLAAKEGKQIVVLAGGCFWGVEAVFEHVKGVSGVTSGYAGGTAKTAVYDLVSAGKTGHAEAVRITYDPSRISYGQILKVFFSVAHNPTELNRQGPDTGTQYRSAIFYANAEQQRIARAYVEQLNTAQVFNRPIVTQIAALDSYYEAESYHQDYAERHPDHPYIVNHDLPKVAALRQLFPALYRSK